MAHQFEVLTTAAAEPAATPGRPPAAPGATGERLPDRRIGADGEIAKLVQHIFLLPGSAKAPGAVAFSGVEHGAGCSWICGRCGEALAAQVPGSVCLVDANLRAPSLHRQFQMEMENGFTDAMNDTRPIAGFAKRVGKTNLWLMSSGAAGRELNGAMSPARLHARFSELRIQFDYLLIDIPPAASSPDGVLLAQMADGVVLVVGSNSTRRETARMVKQNFDAARVPVLGVVLNRRTYPMPEALYRRL
jgi:Mrp family chromosome partitioning ATPase